MRGLTVLLVDDDPSVRGYLSSILQTFGCSVLVAADGAEGLNMANGHDGEIHLLLSDIVMRGMNGVDLAKRFHAIRPKAKILLISGMADDRGQWSFLPKPFTSDELRGKIEAICGDAAMN